MSGNNDVASVRTAIEDVLETIPLETILVGEPTVVVVVVVGPADSVECIEWAGSDSERENELVRTGATSVLETDILTVYSPDAPNWDDEIAEFEVLEPVADGDSGLTIGAPVRRRREAEDGTRTVIGAHWSDRSRLDETVLEQMAFLATHLGMALDSVAVEDRLERMRRELTRREEMVEVYDSILRHDLGNDLQIITGFSDAIQPMVENEDALDYIQRMYRKGEHAAELIDSASTTVATLEEGGDPQARDLEPALSRAVSRSTAEYDSLRTRYVPEAFDSKVIADELLSTAFEHVLANAAVHTDGTVSVDIYSESSPGELVVGFADDGDGIPDEIGDELFQMGKHGPSNDGPGFGLGLVRVIVESYGGEVTAQQTDDGGTDIRVTFVQPQ